MRSVKFTPPPNVLTGDGTLDGTARDPSQRNRKESVPDPVGAPPKTAEQKITTDNWADEKKNTEFV